MMTTLTEVETVYTSEEQFQRARNSIKKNGFRLIEDCYWVEVWQKGKEAKFILVRDF